MSGTFNVMFTDFVPIVVEPCFVTHTIAAEIVREFRIEYASESGGVQEIVCGFAFAAMVPMLIDPPLTVALMTCEKLDDARPDTETVTLDPRFTVDADTVGVVARGIVAHTKEPDPLIGPGV